MFVTTKAKACKGAHQKWNLGITFQVTLPRNVGKHEGMNTHTPKWAFTLELESWWSLEFSKGNFSGQNSFD